MVSVTLFDSSQILPLNITVLFMARVTLSLLGCLIAYLLSDAFPFKLHFPDSHYLVTRRVHPMGGTRRLEDRVEGGSQCICYALCAMKMVVLPVVTISPLKFPFLSVRMFLLSSGLCSIEHLPAPELPLYFYPFLLCSTSLIYLET